MDILNQRNRSLPQIDLEFMQLEDQFHGYSFFRKKVLKNKYLFEEIVDWLQNVQVSI